MIKIKNIVPLYCFLFSIFYGCNKADSPLTDTNRALHEKLAGDYRLETSFANKEVDIDLNGTENRDMIKESGNFKNSKLWISIDKNLLLFEQMWPEEYPFFYEGTILHVNFANQGDIRTFKFKENNTQIVTDTITKTLNGIIIKSPPLSVKIIGNGKIEVVNKKMLYTNKGLEEVIFTSVYTYTGYNKVIFK